MSGPSLALSNLRALTIVVVLGFHSMLAYLGSLPPTPYPFDDPPYGWQAFAIVDSHRFFGFDLFCAWQDVCLMSIFFFLSGMFVWPSLERKGSVRFLADRILRIGLPFVLAVTLLMPIAYYPTYRVTAVDPSLTAYWAHWMSLPFWPCGPQWFLWQLLILNVTAAALHRIAPHGGAYLKAAASTARTHPGRFLCMLMAASALGYIPLALLFSPWSWGQFATFGFQESRPLHYFVYFFAGVSVGAYGLDRGLLARDGLLAAQWKIWLAAALGGFALWMAPTALTVDDWDASAFALKLAASAGFVVACATGCLFVLGAAIRFGQRRIGVLDSLSENAYGLYLVHYIFVVWLQYGMLDLNLPGVIKAPLVFAGTLLLSWAMVSAMRSIPFGARLIGEKR